MIYGVSVQREYDFPGSVPGLAILITTNLTEERKGQFIEAVRTLMQAEWDQMGRPVVGLARVQLWQLIE